LLILAGLVFSLKSPGQEDAVETVKASLQTILPDMEIDKVEESGIPGLYTVMIGAEILYVSADGQYLLKGDLIDIPNRSNLSEEKRAGARQAILKTIPKQEFITFSPDNPRHTVYVFTDITCGFCQKLQGDIQKINDRGIAVNYLAFPREGSDSATARRMQSVWCAKDRQTAFIDAMIGLAVNSPECDNPVTEHFGLGQTMGVNGTPAIFTEDGTYLRGYLPPDELLKVLSKN
jgi:thiol:disulfide interchange protein DsbC